MVPDFKTDEEARSFYKQAGLTSSSRAADIIAVNPKMGMLASDTDHQGWVLHMIDGIPGFTVRK